MYISEFEVFIVIGVIICVSRIISKRKNQEFYTGRTKKNIEQDINELKQRLSDLEDNFNIKRIEKRLQAIESIVVDSDYQLNLRFKRELEGKTA